MQDLTLQDLTMADLIKVTDYLCRLLLLLMNDNLIKRARSTV